MFEFLQGLTGNQRGGIPPPFSLLVTKAGPEGGTGVANVRSSPQTDSADRSVQNDTESARFSPTTASPLSLFARPTLGLLETILQKLRTLGNL